MGASGQIYTKCWFQNSLRLEHNKTLCNQRLLYLFHWQMSPTWFCVNMAQSPSSLSSLGPDITPLFSWEGWLPVSAAPFYLTPDTFLVNWLHLGIEFGLNTSESRQGLVVQSSSSTMKRFLLPKTQALMCSSTDFQELEDAVTYWGLNSGEEPPWPVLVQRRESSLS